MNTRKKQELRQRLYVWQGGRCAICGEMMTRNDCNLDHRIPKAKGGADTRENLQVTHIACNTKKADTIPKGLK